MRWITHQTGAVLGALALAMPASAIACAGLGAIFPDVIDQRLSALAGGRRGRQRAFNRIHRGASHWFGWWLILFTGSMALNLPPILRDAIAGFGFGALSHTALDMLTPAGIPLTPFSRKGKLAVPLCATGHAGEYVFLSGLICAAICYWYEPVIRFIEILR